MASRRRSGGAPLGWAAMSAPSESAASPAPCACTNISLMQLFHELKQKFPGVPDHVVSNTIELYCHDKQACEKHLHSEVKASLTHAYHASSSAAARQLNQIKLNPPLKCRNQPIVKHEAAKATIIKCLPILGPQKGILGTAIEQENTPNIDANQNIVETKNEEIINKNYRASPVTVINIDHCHVKDSPSDFELTNENVKDNTTEKENSILNKSQEETGSTNYRIQHSGKIRSNLPERLDRKKEKKTIKKEINEVKKEEPIKQVPLEKQNRPKTLDFIKPNPDIAFQHQSKQTLTEPESETCRTISPAPKAEATKQTYRPPPGYPLNLSVNVNCHMDLSRGYADPWLEEYESPRAITSVNLTVCTPTSNMASPVRDTREEDGGFEGHVTVTVSPSTARAPVRRAPPPPSQPSRIESPRPAPSRTAPEPPGELRKLFYLYVYHFL